MNLKNILFPTIIIFFVGCGVNNLSKSPQNNGICEVQPSWVYNLPVKKGYVYGVGVAPLNFNGQQAQRKSAISKAINEIASQLKTVVNSQIVSSTSVNNGSVSNAMNSVSFQNVNGEVVSAEIIKSCKNPINGNLYILMRAKK